MLRDITPGRAMQLAPDVAAAFAKYRWPGNLRQLSNVLRTGCALVDDDETLVEWPHLPDDMAEELIGRPKDRPVEDIDTDLRVQADRCIQHALRSCDGNRSEAARRLGISRNTLYRKLGELKQL